jgi:hypothetical protein
MRSPSFTGRPQEIGGFISDVVLRLVDTDEQNANCVRIYVDAVPGYGPWGYLRSMVAAAKRVGGNGWFVGSRSALTKRRFHVEFGGKP